MKETPLIIYPEWAELISNLEDKEAGELIKAICNKRLEKEIEISNQTIEAVFLGIFEKRLDEDNEKYKEKCEKRKTAATKRWGDKPQDIEPECKSMQLHTNAMQMDSNNKNNNKNNNNYLLNKPYYQYKKGNYDFEELENETKGRKAK